MITLPVRSFAPLLLLTVTFVMACGDDDAAGTPTGSETVTPTATIASPTELPPANTPTLEPTITPVPTPVNALTEEIVAAAQTYFSTSADIALEITDPPECSAISALIDAGDALISSSETRSVNWRGLRGGCADRAG